MKTTKSQYNDFKTQSKNKGEFIYKLFLNETNNRIPYPIFLTKLTMWLKVTKRKDLKQGIEIINKYLNKKFA